MTGFSVLEDLCRRGFEGLRVVGDVHGDAAAFAHAVAGAEAAGLFLLQLGDLTDYGPDSPEALRLMFDLLDAGRGRFLLGNHDHKLRRALTGQRLRIATEGLGLTLEQLAEAPDGYALAERAIEEIAQAPAWLVLGPWGFVHAGWHPSMQHRPSPADAGAQRPDPVLSRAMFGQVTGRMRADGYPERLHGWVDRIAAGMTVYCGHDRRSTDGRPLVQAGAQGGRAVFLDTGAGKGGHLSWIDLPFAALDAAPRKPSRQPFHASGRERPPAIGPQDAGGPIHASGRERPPAIGPLTPKDED
ncbi:metallophosphoesterase [Siccirubricoccus sp. G192]|uniref:metallophosphoesterase n=1 Tax=Siccirubricoccus sp. G192 TaxID=2849651 RepID=UPI001C2C2EED|nr:metallophosphoesterase [Siccirubricoccus sp. G192]MBV1799154.1 metallophosphoesterase [Siccirubricoccus sp. G192]